MTAAMSGVYRDIFAASIRVFGTDALQWSWGNTKAAGATASEGAHRAWRACRFPAATTNETEEVRGRDAEREPHPIKQPDFKNRKGGIYLPKQRPESQ